MSEKVNFNTSLGEFVAKYPQTRGVFEKFGLDYCCGGKQLISIAAEEKNISLNELVSFLQNALAETQSDKEVKIWINEPLSEIIDHIMQKHHALMWEKLPYIEALLSKIVLVHGNNHGDFLVPLKNTFIDLKEKLEKHLQSEEQVLFPYVKELESHIQTNSKKPSEDPALLKKIVEVLFDEHDEAGEALSKMRNLTSDYVLPKDACASFKALYEELKAIEDDLHEHVHLENIVLFPRIKKLVSGQIISD